MMMKRVEGPQLHIVVAVQAAEEGNLGREGKMVVVFGWDTQREGVFILLPS